ncbi:hypothetical protein GCM10011608_38300 [Micromonospora sonchi]|uniref:Uncharacterized protein n=1 Tax=Micromonospora sonchi TaxID=1763543 RepID=A0A917X1C8_9ACTN|nr:hypothetical protein GCM10011608_38300 [Micromonospora sonchi]
MAALLDGLTVRLLCNALGSAEATALIDAHLAGLSRAAAPAGPPR